MTKVGHLWAIGCDDMERAAQVRGEITWLGERHCLILHATAVAVRYPDGSLTLDGEPFVVVPKIQGRPLAKLLAWLALGAPPLTGPAAGVFLRRTGSVGSDDDSIDEDFVSEVEVLMKPGTSALFVLDEEGDMDAILQGIRGLGGTVLKTNVDLNRAKLIQSTLTATQDQL
jgi:uncharacterized membrane protein